MSGFTELAIIIFFAAVFGVVARKIRQPEILGYSAAGIMLGIIFPTLKNNPQSLELFSQIGVAFLLFIVGLELDLSEIKKLGSKVLLASLFQVILTWSLALILGLVLKFNFIASFFIAICLTFSSTIVVVKILSQKNELDTLQGKLSVVFLVVQDFAAIAVMILLTTISNLKSDEIVSNLLLVFAKGIFIFALIMFVSKFVMPFLLKIINKERETLFISVIAWALLLSALVSSSFIGFSIEIGALLAGISIADRYEHLQIESWMRPLRDFFLTLFFVLLGLKVSIGSLNDIIAPALIFSAFVLVVKPLIVTYALNFLKYSKRESFYTGLSLGQISEFSLLVVAIGVTNHSISSSVLTLVTVIGGITMICSSYMITYDRVFYKLVSPFLIMKDHHIKSMEERNLEDHVVLLGCHRAGKNVLDYLLNIEEKVIVVDNNPSRIQQLKAMGVDAYLGDLRDINFLDNLKLEKSKFIISTIPSLEINKTVLVHVNDNVKENKPVTLFLAKDEDDVAELYNSGADYVIYPYLLAGQKVNLILKNRNDVHKHKVVTMKNILSSKHWGE